MTVRALTAIILLSIALILLPGCLKPKENTQIVELRMTMWGKQEELDYYNKALESFYKKHPNIRVRIELIPWSRVFDKLLISTAGGRPPDVSRIDSTYFTPCAAKGLLECLDSYIANDSEFDLDDFYGPALEGWGKYDGKVYGLPGDVDIYAMFYNKTMFDKYGIPYPDETWDWNKYLEVARKLTKDLNGDGRIDQWGCIPDPWWQDYVWQNGGEIVSSDGKKCLLDQPEAYEAIQFASDLRCKYRVAPGVTDMADIGPQKMFTNGMVGMYITGSWAAALVFHKEIKTFDYDVAPIPKGKRRAAFMGGAAFGILRLSKHKKEAWELVKFMTGPEIQAHFARTQHIIPSRRSVAESGAYLHLNDKPKNKQAFIDAIEYGYVIPNVECSREMNDIINNEIVLAILGKKSAREACLKVAPYVNDLLKYSNKKVE
ncbi:MAG: sugar ABC transporter substrate-binding protein [Armatimonadota bacterium]|nr:sugar ABC transporter substrate-binding protein [Armatimonadota bacterium]